MENYDKESQEKCPQCRERCPADNLQCGKGRRYFESAKEPRTEGGQQGREAEGRHGGHRGCAEERDCHGDHRRHGGHDRWHEELASGEFTLTGLLCRSGYLAERKSGKQRGQRRILQILTGHSQLSQKALQEKLGIEPGSMSEVIAKLEEKGLIRREKDENDRRRMLISLTEEGRKAAELNSRQEQGDEIFDVLSDEEKKQLRELLMKLLEQWRKQYERYHKKTQE